MITHTHAHAHTHTHARTHTHTTGSMLATLECMMKEMNMSSTDAQALICEFRRGARQRDSRFVNGSSPLQEQAADGGGVQVALGKVAVETNAMLGPADVIHYDD